MRDYTVGDTFDVKFTSRRFSSGAPFTLAGSPVISAYLDNNVTQLTAGLTLSVDFDGVTGLNNIRVVATVGNGYAAGSTYALVITTGTVDGVSVVGEVVGEFALGRSAAFARLGAPAGASVSADVASVKASVGAVTGAVGSVTGSVGSVTAGVTLAASAVQAIWDALTSALTTVGSIGKKLADWTIGTAQTGDAFARLGAPAGASVSADIAAVKVDTAATKAKTDNLPVDPADASDLVGAFSTVAGLIATVQADTDNIQTRLPAALTGAGNMKADALAIDGSTTSAARLRRSASLIHDGAVTGAATATTLIDSGLTHPDTDQLKGRILIFDGNVTAGLREQATDITAFDPALDKLTFTALTQAPASGDTFVIV